MCGHSWARGRPGAAILASFSAACCSWAVGGRCRGAVGLCGAPDLREEFEKAREAVNGIPAAFQSLHARATDLPGRAGGSRSAAARRRRAAAHQGGVPLRCRSISVDVPRWSPGRRRESARRPRYHGRRRHGLGNRRADPAAARRRHPGQQHRSPRAGREAARPEQGPASPGLRLAGAPGRRGTPGRCGRRQRRGVHRASPRSSDRSGVFAAVRGWAVSSRDALPGDGPRQLTGRATSVVPAGQRPAPGSGKSCVPTSRIRTRPVAAAR